MSAAVIAALATAIPAILGAITALVVALRSNNTATTAVKQSTANAAAIQTHQIQSHDKLN